MKKYNKLEIIGFVILMIGFILYIASPHIDIKDIYGNEKIFQIVIPIGLLIWALGHMKKEKEQKEKKNENKS